MEREGLSRRTAWDLRANRISEAVRLRRERRESVIDLTGSNPTRAGLTTRGVEILAELSRPEALAYDPEPRGMGAARAAITALYARRGAVVDPDRVILSASTSEAYTWIFRLLCDPGEAILAPAPSYPLFDQLAAVSDVSLARYPLIEAEGFRMDLLALEEAVTPRTRAVLVVSPGNPSGAWLQEQERERLVEICARHGLAIVCDEVFGDFHLAPSPGRVRTTAGEQRVLTFTLDGISKMLALPQMKLGWMAVSGPPASTAEAAARLEVIADTYLSVNTPVQVALPALLAMRDSIQAPVLARISGNLRLLGEAFPPGHPAGPLPVEGGWSAILRVPSTRSDEDWALHLLEEEGVLVHPGYLFDFPTEGRLVISLLPRSGDFSRGVDRLSARLAKA
jgi:hypothetical protein